MAASSLENYDSNNWCLFIDSLKQCSLKCVLLHISNKLGSLSTVQSTNVEEEYPTISLDIELYA